jgi:hypothetical protein
LGISGKIHSRSLTVIFFLVFSGPNGGPKQGRSNPTHTLRTHHNVIIREYYGKTLVVEKLVVRPRTPWWGRLGFFLEQPRGIAIEQDRDSCLELIAWLSESVHDPAQYRLVHLKHLGQTILVDAGFPYLKLEIGIHKISFCEIASNSKGCDQAVWLITRLVARKYSSLNSMVRNIGPV